MNKLRIGLSLLLTLFILSCSSKVNLEDIVIDSKYFAPNGESKNVAIIFLGGSGGGMPMYNYRAFMDSGYPSLSLGYFKTANTPKDLKMIPLEYFEKAINLFKEHPDVKGKKIVVFGTSKGGELALLLASRFPVIEGVIANVPSSVSFQGIYYDISLPKSSWSYKGRPIPFVPYAKYDKSKMVNNNYVEMYKLSLQKTRAVNKAAIKVENINGPILLLSGEEDIMWPSTQMCNNIIRRLKEKKFSYQYNHFAYKNAGHTFFYGNTLSYGGSSEANAAARKDSIERVRLFLEELSGI